MPADFCTNSNLCFMNEEMLHKFSIVDLTHDLAEGIPIWPDGVIPFKHEMIEDYGYKNYRCFKFSQSEGVGTHIDAPAHFSENGRSISDLKCEELIAPICVIDVRAQVNRNVDYNIEAADIVNWEKRYGHMPEKCMVLGFTGWSQYWNNTLQYLNKDETGIMHFPGFSKGAAELLIERKIVGIGIDTLSIDAGTSNDFIVHKLMLRGDKYQIENLVNLEQLPMNGAWIVALPIKIKGGTEAPARVIALKFTE